MRLCLVFFLSAFKLFPICFSIVFYYALKKTIDFCCYCPDTFLKILASFEPDFESNMVRFFLSYLFIPNVRLSGLKLYLVKY